MNRRAFIAGLCAGIPIGWLSIILFPVLVRGVLDPLAGVNRGLLRSFQKIRINMTKAEVIALMGSDGKQSDTFRLGQRPGYELEYAVGERIGAAYFLSWTTGIDMVLTVAFDNKDRVIYKASGST
jgi:hypothetical protein